MKKKATLIITIVALATMAIVGGTLAWFTSSDAVTNILNAGKIEVAVTEPNFAGGIEGGTIGKIVPGQTITKDPTIQNKGDRAQIRYKVDVKITGKDGVSLPSTGLVFDGAVVGFKINDWVEVGKVEADTALPKLFNSVTIPKTWGNAYQEATLTITVDVQAAQADNFESTDWNNVAVSEWKTTPAVPEPSPTTTLIP